MKKLFFLLIASGGALSTIAQTPSMGSYKDNYATDARLSRVVVDINLLGGALTQDLTTANTMDNYTKSISSISNTGKLTFTNGLSYGFDAQVGYFFGKNSHFGIGTGFMYLAQQGDAKLDQFHVEYQSTDIHGSTFRQLITANSGITEKLQVTNINIPLLLKYKYRFSKRLGFTADLGALFNLQLRNNYSSNASFDYEAIYQLKGVGSDVTAYYDNSAAPAKTDVFYTKAEYVKANPGQNVNNYFSNTLHNAGGLNVGLGVQPNNNSGSVSYATGSVGLLVQPSLNYFFSDMVALNIGGYFLYQPFTNSSNTGYRLTDKLGDYSSVLNTVTASNNTSYGVNLGLRIFVGRRSTPFRITSTDAIPPSICSTCDGSMTLRGLPPGQPVMVNYSMNGHRQPTYSGTVAQDGTVKLNGLCAGIYAGVMASIGKQTANGQVVTIEDPALRITSENSSNPTAYNSCDGTITLYGLRSGQAVTVNYNLNGEPQHFYSGYVGQDNTVTLTHLCPGDYSAIKAAIGKCTATGTDVTLTAPPPPPPPPPVEDEVKVSTPILFELNKTVIHQSSYPVLDEAKKKLDEDKDSYIIVDGYTDITGKPAYNKVLSLKRAKAVKKHLVSMGVNPRRIKVIGHGAKSPVESNDTWEGRMKNRRAVMHLTVGE